MLCALTSTDLQWSTQAGCSVPPRKTDVALTRTARGLAWISLVQWNDLSPEEKASVRSLKVSAQQVEYAGTIESSVSQCEAEQAGELVGLALVSETTVVGFLVLKPGAKAPQWASPESAVISALRIAEQSQGKGFGTKALPALPGWVEQHWPIIQTVTCQSMKGTRQPFRPMRRQAR